MSDWTSNTNAMAELTPKALEDALDGIWRQTPPGPQPCGPFPSGIGEMILSGKILCPCCQTFAHKRRLA